MSAVRHTVSAILRGAPGSQRAPALSTSFASRLTSYHVTFAALALTVGFAGGASAQEAPNPGASAEEASLSLDEVTVTGSRIRRKTDYDTANPTTVVDSDYLVNLGVSNVSQALQMLPANVSTFTATNTGNSSFFAGSTIANLRGLNPFFGSRTLNLVNDRRFVPTNQGDGVDLNFIPFILIERMNIVTGGASAAYGSGAISGVNNVVLNRALEGGMASANFGQTGQSDGRERQVGIAYGTRLLEDRGHFTVGLEYGKSDAVECYDARDWCRQSVGFISNPIVNPFAPPADQVRADGSGVDGPSLVLASDVRANQISQTGVFNTFNPVATSTLQANAAGTGTAPFNLGAQPLASASPYYSVTGGDGESIYQYTNLRAPVERKVVAATFSYDITSTTHFTADLSWGKVDTDNRTQAVIANLDSIQPYNAYLQGNPDLIAAQAASALFPGGFAFFNKDWTSQLNSHSTASTDVRRVAAGLDGFVGSSDWRWDAYAQYGKTDREQVVHDNRHMNAYALAIDSIMGPNGTPICRISSEAQAVAAGVTYDPRIADGCVPLNPFGNQPISDAARAYAFGNLTEHLNYEQSVVAANLSGDLVDPFGAGPIKAATGAEYRIEKGENLAVVPAGTPDYVRRDYGTQYGESFAGKVDVTEAYVETIVPLLQNAPVAQIVELDSAVRYSEYRNTGGFGTTGESRTHGMVTWKGGLKWKPVDWLMVRGTKSRDSRAANFRELYYGQIIGAGGLFGYCSMTDTCAFSLEGNVNLKPEKADTTTGGFVFSPTQSMQLSADYFRIKISDAIQQANTGRVLTGCLVSGLQEFCDLITTAAPGDYSNIETVRALSFNGSGYVYRGIDFSGNFRWDLDGASSVNFRLLATRMIDQRFQSVPGGPFVNVVGQTGTGNSFLSDNQPAADWHATLSATYARGPFSLTGQVRYVSDGVMDYLGATPGEPVPVGGRTLDVNKVPGYEVFTLSSGYRFEHVGPMDALQVYGVVNNLFDKDPPIAPGGSAFGASNAYGGTNATFFDTLGRTFKIELRAWF